MTPVSWLFKIGLFFCLNVQVKCCISIPCLNVQVECCRSIPCLNVQVKCCRSIPCLNVMARTRCIYALIVMFVLCQTNTLNLYSASALKQQSSRTLKHYPDVGKTMFCSYSLKLCDQQRGGKYQCHSLWFDNARLRTPTIYRARGTC